MTDEERNAEILREAKAAEHLAQIQADLFVTLDVPHLVAINAAILLLVKVSPLVARHGVDFRKGVARTLREVAHTWEMGGRVEPTGEVAIQEIKKPN